MLRVTILFVLAHSAAFASEASSTPAELDPALFVSERSSDIGELLFGPFIVDTKAIPRPDCRALYERRLDLLRDNLSYHPRFESDPRHAAAAFVGTIWTPAFYYLPFRAVAETARGRHRRQAAAELDQLRAASAAARCFER